MPHNQGVRVESQPWMTVVISASRPRYIDHSYRTARREPKVRSFRDRKDSASLRARPVRRSGVFNRRSQTVERY
jgi:hypothetical protein